MDMDNDIARYPNILWTNCKCSREIQTYNVAAFYTLVVCYE